MKEERLLRGERVILRAVTRDDYETLARFRSDFEVHVLADDDPFIPHSKEYWEREYEKRLKEPERKHVAFGIEVDGKLIGTCGLFDIDFLNRNAAVGIAINDRNYWGKGVGREAVHLLLYYGFEHRDLHHITLEVLATNERGIRSYRAAGFVEEGRHREHAWASGDWVDSISMGILKEEWAKRHADDRRAYEHGHAS